MSKELSATGLESLLECWSVSMMKKIQLIAIFFFALSLFNCSKDDSATEWVDDYISKKIEYYFEMNSIQSQFLKQTLDDDMDKIKKIIFPELALEMEKVKADVDEKVNLSIDKIVSYRVKLKKIFNKGLIIFKHSAEEFVAQLTKEQLQLFVEKFNENTNNLREELSRPLSNQEKRYNKIKKQLEGWLGSLDMEQIKEIQSFSSKNPNPFKEQVLNRNKIIKEFETYFFKTAEMEKFIHRLFYNYETIFEPSYSLALKRDQEKYIEMLASVLSRISVGQRRFLSKTLSERILQLGKAVNGKVVLSSKK